MRTRRMNRLGRIERIAGGVSTSSWNPNTQTDKIGYWDLGGGSAYTDTALTTLATAQDDPVRGIKDLWNSNNLIGAGAGTVPTFDKVLYTDGALYTGPASLSSGTYNFTKNPITNFNNQDYTIAMQFACRNYPYGVSFFQITDLGSNNRIISTNTSISGVGNGFIQTFNDSPGTPRFGGPYPLDPSINHVLLFCGQSGQVRIRLDGVDTVVAENNAATNKFFRFMTNTIRANPEMHIRKLATWGHTATASEIASIENTWGQGFTGPVYPDAAPLVAFDGNSLFNGESATAPSTDSPPAVVRAGLSGTKSVPNFAVFGDTIARRAAVAPNGVFKLYRGGRTKNILFFWEITNSLVNAVSAATTLAQLQAYGLAAKAAGYTVVLVDCMDRTDFTAGNRTSMATVNAALAADFVTSTGITNIGAWSGLGTQYADYLVQVSLDTHLGGVAPWVLNSTYWAVDNIHLTTLGYAWVANTYCLPLLSVLGIT